MQFTIQTVLAVFLSSMLTAMGLGGGSILLLYLMMFTDISQPMAQAYNLLLFLPCSALAIVFHQKNHLLRLSSLKKILPWGILGGILGSLLGNGLDASFLRKVFAVFLLCMGLSELWSLWHKKKNENP